MSTSLLSTASFSHCTTTESPRSLMQASPQGESREITHFLDKRPSACANFIRVLLLVCLLFNVVSALSWDCPAPRGSYSNSCELLNSYPYRSSDSNLQHIKFCKYEVVCKKVDKPDHDRRISHKVLPREDIACGSNWENCDGYLIGRKDDARLCVDKQAINAQLKEHALIALNKDEL